MEITQEHMANKSHKVNAESWCARQCKQSSEASL